MKPLFTFLLLCTFVINSAQNPEADSPLMILKQTKNIGGIAKLQNQISEPRKFLKKDWKRWKNRK